MGRFFQYRALSGRVVKKSRVPGGFGLGRSVEIVNRVFPVPDLLLGISGYFGYTRCSCLPKMSGNT